VPVVLLLAAGVGGSAAADGRAAVDQGPCDWHFCIMCIAAYQVFPANNYLFAAFTCRAR
jgi:hypothetical protein